MRGIGAARRASRDALKRKRLSSLFFLDISPRKQCHPPIRAETA
jgi:hypothetical protein